MMTSFLSDIRETKKRIKKRKPDISVLNEIQLDFYLEREAIEYIEAIEEFGKCDELALSWKIFEEAKKLF